MLESLIVKAARDFGLRESEDGLKATLKSGAFEPALDVPWIRAEEAYAPPATPIRRTRSKE